jgi:hypothetical protein
MQSTIKTEATTGEEATSTTAVDNQQQGDELTVDVSIEPNHECEIIEVKYDGQEIYKELVLSG